MNNYYNTQYAQVGYDAQEKYVVCIVKGFMPFDHFQEVWNNILEACNNHQISKILIDARESKIITPESQQWLIGVMMPKMLQQLRNVTIARLISVDIFSQLSVNAITQQLHPNILIKQFGEESSAKDWLKDFAIETKA
ncbi:MAG: hypothetical protein EAZ55_12245 [Cytophagales bacterium]|nr:MAG: hypothetical protein EAZ55_12245 [Cytophagales bacterium]